MESGKEQNYWPGFVDALSNVVLTLVFVLVVFVFALVMASSKVSQKVQELAVEAEKKAASQTQNSQEVIELKRELHDTQVKLDDVQQANVRLQNEIVQLKRQQPIPIPEEQKPHPPVVDVPAAEERNALTEKVQVTVDKAPDRVPNPDRDDNPLIDGGTGVIIVTFPRGIFEVTDQARAELTKVLGPQKGRLSGMTISLKSVMGVETYSEARRLAYFRGLGIRNYLMENGFGRGQNIKVVIEEAKEVDDGRVEIRFNSH